VAVGRPDHRSTQLVLREVVFGDYCRFGTESAQISDQRTSDGVCGPRARRIDARQTTIRRSIRTLVTARRQARTRTACHARANIGRMKLSRNTLRRAPRIPRAARAA
jgi:hypothetical protein